MQYLKHTSHRSVFALALLTSVVLGGCLGGDNSGWSPESQVTFGDSLSDVGTYAVGAVLAANGGKYTVNSIPKSPQNWSELIALQMGLPLPCAAQTGLDGDPAQGFNVPSSFFKNCTDYAQGGARVTNPIGQHNKAIDPQLGQLTVPVATQIQNHLNKIGGAFSGTEIVFVWAGANDLLSQSDALTATVLASLSAQIAADISSGACVPVDSTGSNCLVGAIEHAVTAAAPTYTAAMETAGTELATLINNQILANGATHVVVLNLPDVSKTPSTKGQPSSILSVAAGFASAFNAKLAQGLGQNINDKVILIDTFSTFGQWSANPSAYGFSNFTDTACNLTKPSPNPLGSSLVCNTNNVITGDVSKYAFADTVHPTPYTHSLIAGMVLTQLKSHGWY